MMMAVVERGVAPALLAVLLASCSLTHSANVIEDDPLEALPASDGIAAPSVALVTETQVALTDLGYGPGPADGIIGPQTKDAIARFQDDYGLSATPWVGEALVAQLRYVSCVRNGTRDVVVGADTTSLVPAHDCESLLQSDTIQAVTRLPGISEFIEASEIVAVGIPIIPQSGDYGRLGYRDEESDQDGLGDAGGGAVASAGGGTGSGPSQSSQGSEPESTTDSQSDTSGGGNRGRGKGGKGSKGGGG